MAVGVRNRQRGAVLSDRQRALINAYLTNGYNMKQACIAAKYSNSVVIGACQKPFQAKLVAQEIERRMTEATQRADVTVDWLIERFKRIADAPEIMALYRKVDTDGTLYYDFTNAPIEHLALIHEMSAETILTGPKEAREAVKKFKVSTGNVEGALNSLGRIKGAFKDNVNVTGADDIVARLQAGRARAKANKENGDG